MATNNIIEDNLWGWQKNLGEAIKSEIPNWQKFFNQASLEYGNAGGLKKNPLVVARTLELAWEANEKSSQLLLLVEKIISFAKTNFDIK